MAVWNIIADDLTGACDTGAVFAQAGLKTLVLLDSSAREEMGCPVEVVAVTTESRHLPASEAAERVQRAVEGLAIEPGSRVYKKIDSTLRGQPGAELAALMGGLGLSRALVAPAFPGQGRLVCGGQLWVNGARFEDTVFAGEAVSGELGVVFAELPVRLLGLEEVRRGLSWLAERISGTGVWLADAETDGDLQLLAAAARQGGIHLLCGSAGLARAAVAVDRAPAASQEQAGPRGGPVLVVVGSRHPATLRQVTAAERTGMRVFRPAWDDLRIAKKTEAFTGSLVRELMEKHSLVLSAEGMADKAGAEAEVADGLAGLACTVLRSVEEIGGLALTGGDTAAAVCRALGCRVIAVDGEILPGLGWGHLLGGSRPNLLVATKAGGFGADMALVEAVNFLLGPEQG